MLRLFRRLTRKDSLVGRLIRLASVWFIFSLVITGIALTAYFHQAALQRFQLNVKQIADNLYADTDIDHSGKVVTPPFFDTRTNRVYSGLYWQVSEIDAKGAISDAARSRSLWNEHIPIPATTLGEAKARIGEGVFYDSIGPEGEPLRVAAVYSKIDGRAFVFLAAEDRAPMDKDVRRFALITAAALIVLALGSLVAIFIQVRVGLRPLFDLTDEIAHIQGGTQQRLLKSYPAEITPVATQLNAFLDYSQEVVERQRMHVGNLAHALKTPLAVLMASAGSQDGELPEIMRKQAETMRAQVDHHLRRARAAARSQALGERTPVEPVLDELAVMLEQVFQDKGVIIDWRTPDDLAFRGEKQDLQEIAGNLLENASIWCRKKVRITAEFNPVDQSMSLAIEDDGPGLDEARFDEVLKRGARLDESVPGSGLGLSIVDELVRAYGGTLTFGKSQIGGLKVLAKLPANLDGAAA
ncbi:ATP-binding protein [Asticcacaulis sp. 201]|nr:ATP-binding protein [Asticcacaulis sp. 201]MDV6331911.1 ATP-binding protein [Asticcacaulis sp. 201]